jgi:choline dehydrogenase
VILSGGAVNSPQLDDAVRHRTRRRRCKDHGIEVRLDQPNVGRHLQDHLCVDHIYRANIRTLNDELGRSGARSGTGLNYLLRRRGPLSLGVNQAGGFVRSRPDLGPAQHAALFLAGELHQGAARQTAADEPGPVSRPDHGRAAHPPDEPRTSRAQIRQSVRCAGDPSELPVDRS